ncbi:hypothetical protein RFF05_01790 [Bengtsoniella intestinalis]|uniref:phage tail terminator family protein n=1 Tax=Bengtsoniella intestinalis TaxID=3073143 RepID=UPI00391F1A1B
MDTQQLFIAVAQVLGTLFPDSLVFQGPIPQGADGQMHIGLRSLTQTHQLGKRFYRKVTLEVRYFLATRDDAKYMAWGETMLDGLRTLEGDDWQLPVINPTISVDESGLYCSCNFNVELYFRETGETAEVMEKLYYTIL